VSEKKEMEIFISDPKKTAQKRILKFLGLKTAEEGNLDIMPLAIVP